MVKAAKEPIVDGRRLRSERSRRAIIDACLELMKEGNLIPTAQQISDRSGVGIRSFFRHFEDMETLFASIDAQIRDSVEALFIGGNREGSLAERIMHAMERRSSAFEIETNTMLSTAAQLWRSETLRKNYGHYQRGLRKDLEAWLPEVRSVSASRREAIDAITSFEMWHRLRYHQKLDKEAAIAVLVELLTELVPD